MQKKLDVYALIFISRKLRRFKKHFIGMSEY